MNQCKTALHQTNDGHKHGVCLCGNCFTIYHGPYGVLFSPGVDLLVMCQLMKAFANTFDYDICDSLIAYETKSALCLTTKEKSEKWRTHLNLKNQN